MNPTLQVLAAGALMLAMQAAGQVNTRLEWNFATMGNRSTPIASGSAASGAEAVVAPGPFSVGWQERLAGFGSGHGYWDLGRNGTITVKIPYNSTASARRISVQIVQWIDGGIYSDLAAVSVPGAVQVGSSGELGPVLSVGGWESDQSEWSAAAGVTMDAIEITGAHNGSIIDSVTVEVASTGVPASASLSIRRMSGPESKVEISWVSGDATWVLQGAARLDDPQQWETVNAPVRVNGDVHSVTVNSDDMRFFRLTRP